MFLNNQLFPIADFYDLLLAKYYGNTYYVVDWATDECDDRSCKITYTEHDGKLYITDVEYLEMNYE